MAIIDKHIRVAVELITDYDFNEPFHHYLNRFFKQNRQMGSQDRKTVRNACYGYFRFGNALKELSVEEKIRLLFWSQGVLNDFPLSAKYLPEKDLETFIQNSEKGFDEYFPCSTNISKKVGLEELCKNHLKHGKVFFRKTAKGKMIHQDFISESGAVKIADNLFSIDSATSLNSFVNNGLIQIQDIASQKICTAIEIGKKCWDICAGSGGKTLHLHDIHPNTSFFVSDIRESIIQNLQLRAKSYALQEFPYAVINLEERQQSINFSKNNSEIQIGEQYFDTIISDVPCTGSGVWGRNPENLLGFDCSMIEKYSKQQQTIVQNALPFLKKGGKLHYITCSVFERENEGHIDFFEKRGFKLLQHRYYNFQNEGGDIMFCASYLKE
ncbi:MAG: hypothetical protein J5I91_04245 [Bacteroidetes bacterium]|nr:hypothetical protein [Bacteroidota bacterium]